ncbi:MAG: allantoicase [Chitinophagaceae bacterium]|nr:allantoicase [Chitinophagaceae bacterium]HQU55961.1 allantoicase [Chitinophagaceae bacterium]
MVTEKEQPAFTKMTNLAAVQLGAQTLACSDDFFAAMENLIKPGRGIFIADKYTDRGKWMDGWESRRKRTPGNDWCIIRLATTGKIEGVDIDTNHFLGNHPPFASIEAVNIPDDTSIDFAKAEWKEILPKSPLQPGAQNFYTITDDNLYTHIKLTIYPDGGVARLKVYGQVVTDWTTVSENETINLAAATLGAKSLCCNDMFFSHIDNLLLPGKGVNMGDGWETKRSRVPNNKDWVIIRLAHKGLIKKAVIDTCYFKGNYPDSCTLEGCLWQNQLEDALTAEDTDWQIILPQSKLSADCEQVFTEEIKNKGPFTHVRLTIFPDGGISRLRLWGNISK